VVTEALEMLHAPLGAASGREFPDGATPVARALGLRRHAMSRAETVQAWQPLALLLRLLSY